MHEMSDYEDREYDAGYLRHCGCGREALEYCCCCGAPLCFMCFEVGAGFCGASDCFTEERIDAMEQELRGDEEDTPGEGTTDNLFMDL
jgi:hypothetical protein